MSILAVTDATFSSEVLDSTTPVLVDFWADWCVPCRQLTPILEELSQTYAGKVKFVSVDTNANPQAMASNDIRTLPTVYIFSGGQIVESFLGSVPKSKLKTALDKF